MKCADPVLCYLDGKGNRIFRHFSIARKSINGIPKSHIVFDCGKCLHCRKKRAYELAYRCVLHSSLYKENCFLTLTYDEKRKGYHNELDYSHIQKFKKRLRSFVSRRLKRTIELFNVHEYGENGKKHWHLICFNFKPSDGLLLKQTKGNVLYTSPSLEKIWGHGLISFGDVSEASAMYTALYTKKDIKNGNITNGKKSKSNHSGIGKTYFLQNYRQILMLGFVPINGVELPVPRYFIKLAHKHYAHFYDPSFFCDTPTRKALYARFNPGMANKEIADLYIRFKQTKNSRIAILEEEWKETLTKFFTTSKDPDFIISNENVLYDLNRKNLKEIF
nr:MAG: replication initiator protein [Microvirus sp.]